jgi:hypothetical protein
MSAVDGLGDLSEWYKLSMSDVTDRSVVSGQAEVFQ